MAEKIDVDALPKRRVAAQIAYRGQGYYGLQYNKNENERLPTIEGELFAALKKTNLVPLDIMEEPKKMSYSNASRTDKNVSAVGQVVTFKTKFQSEEQVKNAINQHLPEHIRVLKIIRATKNFSPKNKCDFRTYSYMMPSYCLINYEDILNPIKDHIRSRTRMEKISSWEVQEPLVTSKILMPQGPEVDQKLKDFRACEKTLKPLESVLRKFIGTHSFHNFTSGVKKGQMEAKRCIKECYVNRSYRPVIGDHEWLEIKIVGQSFMIHQIRKMMGLALATVTGWAGNDHWNRAWTEPLEDVPRAPGDGLVLESVHYDHYNNWLNNLGDPDKKAENVEWNSIHNEMVMFKEKYVLPTIVKESLNKETGMYSWLESLKMHDYTGGKARAQLNKNIDRQYVDPRKTNKQKNFKPQAEDYEDSQIDAEVAEGDKKPSWFNLIKGPNSTLDESTKPEDVSVIDKEDLKEAAKKAKTEAESEKEEGSKASGKGSEETDPSEEETAEQKRLRKLEKKKANNPLYMSVHKQKEWYQEKSGLKRGMITEDGMTHFDANNRNKMLKMESEWLNTPIDGGKDPKKFAEQPLGFVDKSGVYHRDDIPHTIRTKIKPKGKLKGE